MLGDLIENRKKKQNSLKCLKVISVEAYDECIENWISCLALLAQEPILKAIMKICFTICENLSNPICVKFERMI